MHLFAGLRVRDFGAAEAWYERLLGQPTFFPHDTEAVWTLAEDRSVYIVERAAGAGHSVTTIFVDDLDRRTAEIAARGLEPDERETYSNGVRKVIYRDPDGNELGFAGPPAREPDERMGAMNAGSATTESGSLWPRVAGLPLVIEACEYERLHAVLAYEFERVTTHVRLVGAGAEGLGEDVSVFREDGTALHETQPALPLAGEWTLAGFCEHLATLELWPEPPEWDVALRFRRWAFESAALDLALRQAGRSLHDVLGLEPQPVRFVNSLGLGKEPSIEPVRRRLARSPGVRFKLDAEATWPPALVDEVAATGAVDTIDFKGHYGFEVEDPEALDALYDHVLSGVSGRLSGGSPRPARDRSAARRSARARVLRRADPHRRRHRRDAACRRASSTSSRRASAACGRCSRSTHAAHGSAGRCMAAVWASWASAAGRSSCSLRCSTPMRPTTLRRAPSTRTTRRDGLPASPLAPRPRGAPASAGRRRRMDAHDDVSLTNLDQPLFDGCPARPSATSSTTSTPCATGSSRCCATGRCR